MTLIAGIVTLVIIGIIRGSPDSPLGRALRIYLVEKPVKAASRIKRHHLIWIGVLLVMAYAAGEIATVFGTDFLIAYSLDMSLYLDAVLVTAAVAAASRLRMVVLLVRSRMQQWTGRIGSGRPHLGRPRARGRHGPQRHDNDEDGPFPAVLAA